MPVNLWEFKKDLVRRSSRRAKKVYGSHKKGKAVAMTHHQGGPPVWFKVGFGRVGTSRVFQ